MAKVKFANLINLILNREVIPELLQFKCNAVHLASKLEELISNPQIKKDQIQHSVQVLKMLGMDAKEKPSQKAAKAILKG